jgi:MoxR-like ATPase
MTDFFESSRGLRVFLSEPSSVPETNFVGRTKELDLCKAAFGITENWTFDESLSPLHFRLEGNPGVGKNEIVYEIARHLAQTLELPFYSIQGHEEMTPEDLSVLVVPDPSEEGPLGLRLRASPLATALYVGGLFFFDEINRVPERALTPLASVLDKRQSLYSATTGLIIEPRDPLSKKRFRFCCAVNPKIGEAGRASLPDYIDERTLPVIEVRPHDLESLREILKRNVTNDDSLLDGFEEWYEAEAAAELSARQVMALVTYAFRTRQLAESGAAALHRSASHFVRPAQLRTATDRNA